MFEHAESERTKKPASPGRDVAESRVAEDAPASGLPARVPVSGLAFPIQRTTVVGSTADVEEVEAERVARSVVRALRGSGGGRRDETDPGHGQEAVRDVGPIRRAALIGSPGGAVDSETERVLAASSGRGSSIEPGLRGRLEGALGADLSGVRLHAGAQAAELNRSMSAIAFTHGRDIHFRDGLPDTGTDRGLHLLAHELTHTVQQGTAPIRRTERLGTGPVIVPGVAWPASSSVVRRTPLKSVFAKAWAAKMGADKAEFDTLLRVEGKELGSAYRPNTDGMSAVDLRRLRDLVLLHAGLDEEMRKFANVIDGEAEKLDPTPELVAQEETRRDGYDQRMAAETARHERLISQGLAGLGGQGASWAERSPQIKAWFERLKAGEEVETFATAFATNRLTARQVGARSRDPIDVPHHSDRKDKAREKKVPFARDIPSLVERGKPATFFDPNDPLEQHGQKASKKNPKGLYENPATLLDGSPPSTLDGSRSIFAQLKHYEDSYTVFMPAPSETDMQIFNAIKTLTGRNTAEYRKITSQFTRMKMAQGSDMHTGYLNTSKRLRDKPKIRYGLYGNIREQKTDDKEAPWGPTADSADIAARRNNAMEHSTILGAGAKEKVNEIVMAYRSSKSKLFPMITKWDKDKKIFKCMRVVGTSIVDGTGHITDDGVYMPNG